MAQRPIWRGHLRLALVTCPVALFTAKHDRNAIRFNLINPTTGNRIRMKTVDAETEDELERRDLVKGYEYRKDAYLLLTNDDLAGVMVESSNVMSVEKFIPASDIDPIYYDAAYYLAPDGDAGRDVYQVLREAIARSGRVALSRVVIGQRERVIAIRPYADGLAAHTLAEQRDINDPEGLFDKPMALDDEMIRLATMLIDRQTATYDAADIEDRYEARLRAMIDAKLKGLPAPKGIAPEPAVTQFPDIIATLKRSLELEMAPAPERDPPKPRRKRARSSAPAES